MHPPLLDSLFAEIADQVKGCTQGYDILEKEQAQKTHVAYSIDRNNGAGGSNYHRTGNKEHDCCDEPPRDTGLRFEIAGKNQYGGSNFGKPDQIGADISTE